MPLYDWECDFCKTTAEQHNPLGAPPIACPGCGRPMAIVISATSFSVQGETGVIVSDKQIESSHGKRWRDEGTTGKAGGVGRKMFFHD